MARIIQTIKGASLNIHLHAARRKNLLNPYRAYHNHVRYHSTLGGPPTPMEG